MQRLSLPRNFRWLLTTAAMFAFFVCITAAISQQPQGQERQPEPDKNAVAKKEATLKKMFKDDLAKAKNDTQAARDLAELLIREARQTTEDRALQYIALVYARDLAAQAGDTALALSAIQELTNNFTIDTLSMKADMLLLAAQKATSKDDNIAIVEQALTLLEEAMANDNYKVAESLVKAADDAATKSKVLQLVARVEKAGSEVEQAKKEFGRMSKFVDMLAKNKDDAEANREMGRYFCLVKGNWERGLPMLIKGEDKDYAALAKRDLANPKETVEQLQLAEDYDNLADNNKGLTQKNLLKRAYYWYVKGLPSLSAGLNKIRVEKRIEEISQLFPTSPLGYAAGAAKIDTLIRTFERGHAQGIQVLAISNDGKHVVSGGIMEPAVRIWDMKTGQAVRVLNGHKDEIWGVAWSPDDKMVASASSDKTMRTWDAKTGDPIRTFSGHDDWVRGVYFFPDKKRILTASDDFSLRIWDLNNANVIKRVPAMGGHTQFINSLSVSRDGKRALTGSVDRTVRLWDLEKGEQVIQFAHNDEVWAVAISPDGRKGVSASTDNVVKMFDLDAKQEIRKLEHPARVWSIAFAPNGKQVVTGTGGVATMTPKDKIEGGWPQQGNNDASLYFWDVDSGKAIRRLSGHGGIVRAVAFSSDGRFVVSGGDDNTIRLWGEKK
jgi:WD40 repeat protein